MLWKENALTQQTQYCDCQIDCQRLVRQYFNYNICVLGQANDTN